MKSFGVLALFWVVLTASGTRTQREASRLRGLKSSRSQSLASHKSFKFQKSDKTRRNCKYSDTEESVEFKCSAKTGKTNDKIEIRLETGEYGAEIGVKYKHDNHTDNGLHSKSEEKFDIVFYSLIEYTPQEGEDLAYEWVEDNIVQTLELSEWDEFSTITKDRDGVHHFEVTTEDGVARFVFKFSDEDNEAMQLSANRIKVDVHINYFPWQRNDTLVALLCTVDAKTKIHSHYHSKKSGKSRSSKGTSKDTPKPKHPIDVSISFDQSTSMPFGEFSWVATADVDNNTVPGEVVATSRLDDYGDESSSRSDEERAEYIAFSFLNSTDAQHIYWDPEAGIGYDQTSGALRMSATSTLCHMLSVAWGLFALLK